MAIDEAAKSTALAAFLDGAQRENARKNFFVVALMNPTFHWHFTQGQQALEQELYLPGVSALLNGIEASVRVTMAELGGAELEKLELSNYQLLSNTLLRKARDAGLPVGALCFPDENDFERQLDTKTDVKVVALRHDICHGNILNFIQTTEGEEPIQVLTPECLRPTTALLLGISLRWARDLAEFRTRAGLRPNHDLPAMPENVLQEWLPKRGS